MNKKKYYGLERNDKPTLFYPSTRTGGVYCMMRDERGWISLHPDGSEGHENWPAPSPHYEYDKTASQSWLEFEGNPFENNMQAKNQSKGLTLSEEQLRNLCVMAVCQDPNMYDKFLAIVRENAC